MAAAAAPDLLPAPSPGQVAQQRGRASRSDTLAMLESGKLELDTPAKPGADAKPADKPAAKPAEPKPSEAAPTETETEVDEVEETADDAPEVAAAAATATATTDPDTAKRVAAIQQAEKRSRDKITAQRAELDALSKKLEAEWSPRIKAAEDFEALKGKVRKGSTHFVDALRSLGLSEDDFEPAAQVLYAHSKAGAADPARKAAAERMMREREHTTELEATQKRLEQLEQKLTQKEQQATFESQRSAYLDHVAKAIGDEAPLAKALAAKNPAKLRAKLWETTVALTEANDGDVPDPSEVLAAYEKTRRAELEELGVDVSIATKKPTPPAEKKQSAKTLGTDLSTQHVPRTHRGERESRAETLALIEAGKLD